MLTTQQYRLILFVDDYVQKHGVVPSYEEITKGLGLRSRSNIHRLLHGLEERGFIEKIPRRARAFRLTHSREQIDRLLRQGKQKKLSELVADEETDIDGGEAEMLNLPFYGRIAAGTPIEAISTQSGNRFVPQDFIGRGVHYVLEVEGDSMQMAGILDGDLAVIRHADTARPGQIVVALIDRLEATLKTYMPDQNLIRLIAENPAYDDQIYHPDQVTIQGTLAAIIRQY